MRKKKIARKHAPSQRSDLAQTLARQLLSQHSISAGQRIGVAVSGGADSVALLRLLLELRERLGFVLSVVHFNHQLRGRASDSDEKFVGKLAAQYRLPFLVARENVAAKAKQARANLEETARRSRYAYFQRLVDEGHIDRVAVAHTADDQAETVLSHILRGTGITGLGGIHPQAGAVFRPLLNFRRADLRAYLRSMKQSWREDATNRDTTRTRARIRRKLIPFLEKHFQPAVEHLRQLAELAREDEAWMEGAAESRVFGSAKEKQGSWQIPIGELGGENQRPASEGSLYKSCVADAIGKRVIRLVVKKVKPRVGQLSSVHVDAVLRLARDRDSGKALHLPGGVEVRRERDFLCFRPLAPSQPGSQDFTYPIDLTKAETELRIVEHSLGLRFRVIDWLSQGRETIETGAVLDRDRLGVSLVVRNWRPGDAMRPLGHQRAHALSRLLNELGVSRWEKAGWPVLVSGEKITWTRGLPVAVEFAAGKSTRTGVLITEVPLS
jgi:tRNA(Ile)-lysidine synthase